MNGPMIYSRVTTRQIHQYVFAFCRKPKLRKSFLSIHQSKHRRDRVSELNFDRVILNGFR